MRYSVNARGMNTDDLLAKQSPLYRLAQKNNTSRFKPYKTDFGKFMFLVFLHPNGSTQKFVSRKLET